MYADLMEINGVKEIIGSLDCTVDAEAQLTTDVCIINRVDDLIDLIAHQRTQGFPIRSIKCLLESISEVTDIAINRHFLKHGTIVGSTAATARRIVLLFLEDIQLVNAAGVMLDLIRSVLCRTSGTISCTAISRCQLLCRSVCAAARQTGDKHIDHVQQGCDLTAYKVDCRGKRIDNRCSHSTQAILEVHGVRSHTVHALGESTSHQIAVFVEIVDTILQRLSQRRQGEADKTVHSNSLKRTEHLPQTRGCLLDTCSKHVTHGLLKVRHCGTGFRSRSTHFRQCITQLMQCTSTQRKSLLEYTADTVQDTLEEPGLLCNLVNSSRGFLYLAGCLRYPACGGCCHISSRHCACTCRRNRNSRDTYITKFTQFPECLTHILKSFNISQCDLVHSISNITDLLCDITRNLNFAYLADRLHSLTQTFQFGNVQLLQYTVQLLKLLNGRTQTQAALCGGFQFSQRLFERINTFRTFVSLSLNLKLKTFHLNAHRSLPLLSSCFLQIAC